MCLFGVCTDFAPRVGACAACRAREGIGGSPAKPIVQTKSAADAVAVPVCGMRIFRPCRKQIPESRMREIRIKLPILRGILTGAGTDLPS